MVATRLSLLSLAAAASGMFGLWEGGRRAGRVERRLPQPDAVGVEPAAASANARPASLRATPLQAVAESTWSDPFAYPPDHARGTVFPTGGNRGPPPGPKPTRTPVPGVSGIGFGGNDLGAARFNRFDASDAGDDEEMPTGLGDILDDVAPDDASVTNVVVVVPTTASPQPVAPGLTTSALPAATPVAPFKITVAPTMPTAATAATAVTATGLSDPDGNVSITAPWETVDVPICEDWYLPATSTSYSIVYTETITWTEDPKLYTPPFAPDTTPEESCFNPQTPTPVKMTMSRCQKTGSRDDQTTCETTMTTLTLGFPIEPFVTPASPPPAITVLVTAKNPAIVFSPISTPLYNGVPTKVQNPHDVATAGGPGWTPPDYGGGPGVDLNPGPVQQVQPPITLAVQPHGVLIGGQTFSDDPSAPTQVVTVGGNPFTINPSEVIGAGATVNRQAAVGGAFVPAPTSTNVAGLSVFLSGPIAVIDGTTFTIPLTATTATVKGQLVTLGPNGVAVASQTFSVSVLPLPTSHIVVNAELITALGQSVLVLEGRTVTYGGMASVTDIDGDRITLGPSAVTLHGTTLGGSNAAPGATVYDWVGGATLTQIGASVAVIASVTYTVGPGTGTTTTRVGGVPITVAPAGVTLGSQTVPYPFGPTTVLSPTPGASASAAMASPTANAAPGAAVRRAWALELFLTCTAIGVQVLGFLL